MCKSGILSDKAQDLVHKVTRCVHNRSLGDKVCSMWRANKHSNNYDRWFTFVGSAGTKDSEVEDTPIL